MRRLLVAFGIALGVASCRLVAGIDDRSVSHGDAGTALSICRDERAACDDDPACHKALACLDACRGDIASVTACRIKCRRTLPTSFVAPTTDVLACQAQRCGPECSLSCGGYLYTSAVCEACAKAACCARAAACAANAECLNLTSCSSSCSIDDGPCKLNCEHDHAAGVAPRRELEACLSGSCASTCSDSAWACLGRESRPAATGTGTMHVTAIDLVTNAPLSGVALRACADEANTCDGPVLGTTDGRGEIEVPSLAKGCLYFDGADLVPSCAVIEADGPLLAPLVHRSDRDRLFGASASPGKGVVLAFVHDCTGVPGAGATLVTTSGARTLYWRGGRFVADAFETDATGIAAMVDLPAPERRVVRAEVSSSLPAIHQLDVLVRPDIITSVNLEP